MIDFNINFYVEVKLTDVGRKELKRKHEEYMCRGMTGEYVPRKEDENGWSRWQLWALINSLGHLVDMGSEPPFETTIRIDVDM